MQSKEIFHVYLFIILLMISSPMTARGSSFDSVTKGGAAVDVNEKSQLKLFLQSDINTQDMLLSMLKLSEIYLHEGETDSAEYLIDDLHHKMSAFWRPQTKYLFYKYKAWLLLEQKKPYESRQYIDKAKRFARDNLKKAAVMELDIHCLLVLGETDLLMDMIEKVELIYRHNQKETLLAEFLTSIASDLYDKSEYDAAISIYEKLLDIYQSNNHIKGVVDVLCWIGDCQYMINDLESADLSYKQSLTLSTLNDLPVKTSMAMFKLGKLQAEKKDHEKAIVQYKEALDIASKLGLTDHSIDINIELLHAYMALGQYHDALAVAERTKEIIGEDEYLSLRSDIEYNSALANLALKNDDMVLENLTKYVSTLEVMKNKQKNCIKTRADLVSNNRFSDINHKMNLQISRYYGYLFFVFFLLFILVVLQVFRNIRYYNSKHGSVESYLSKSEEVINEFETSIKELEKKDREIRNLSSQAYDGEKLSDIIEKALFDQEQIDWLVFEEKFKLAYPEFIPTLYHSFPKISLTEIKLCMLVKLDISNKEIAYLTNKSIRTVETLRTRLRKKLNLPKSTNLNSYIKSLGNV